MNPPGPRPEPGQDDVEAACPDWTTWVGTDQLCHARSTCGAALTVTGEDWLDLRDQVIRAEAKLLRGRPEAWQ